MRARVCEGKQRNRKEPKTDQLDEIRVFPQKAYVVGQRIHPENGSDERWV